MIVKAESGRKLKIGQIKKEAIPIGFFAIIGVILTIIKGL
jgi:hypothetical protein